MIASTSGNGDPARINLRMLSTDALENRPESFCARSLLDTCCAGDCAVLSMNILSWHRSAEDAGFYFNCNVTCERDAKEEGADHRSAFVISPLSPDRPLHFGDRCLARRLTATPQRRLRASAWQAAGAISEQYILQLNHQTRHLSTCTLQVTVHGKVSPERTP